MHQGENNLILGEKLFMWVITVYSKENTKMFEFNTEIEARETFENIRGCKILSHVVYFNDPDLALATG
jgi:hypothetical protein